MLLLRNCLKFLLGVAFLLPVTCFSPLTSSAQAKNSAEEQLVRLDQEIDALNKSITALQQVIQTAQIADRTDVDRLNSAFLKARQEKLKAKQDERLLLVRIIQLQKYQAAIAGVQLTREEKAQIKQQIEELERERGKCDDCGQTDTDSPVQSKTRLAIETHPASPRLASPSPAKVKAPSADPPAHDNPGDNKSTDKATNSGGPHATFTDPSDQQAGGGANTQPPQGAPAATNPPAAGGNSDATKSDQKAADEKQTLPLQAVTGKVLSGTSGIPLDGITVQVWTSDRKSMVTTTLTGSDGIFRAYLMQADNYQISIDCGCELYRTVDISPFDVPENQTITIPDVYMAEVLLSTRKPPKSSPMPESLPVSRFGGGELTRVIAGFEQSGASASPSKQNFFYDMYVTVPLATRLNNVRDPIYGPKWRLWGDVRISSAPKDFSQPIGEFIAGFSGQVSNTKVSEVARSADWLAGLEYGLDSLPWLLPSFDQKTKQKFSVSLIADAGAITPLNPNDTLQVFNASQEVIAKYSLPSTTQFVAFTGQDRNRFFRQYAAGVRFKTHYFDLVDRPLYRFPAYLDITYGVDESVTRGRIRGGVLKIEGFYPMPWDNVKYIYFFGTAKMKPARAQIGPPLILQAAPANTPVPGPNTAIVTLPQIDRDFYRIGVGVDFVSLFKTILDANTAKKAQQQSTQDATNMAEAQAKAKSKTDNSPAPVQ